MLVARLLGPNLSLAQVFFIAAIVAAAIQLIVVLSHGNAMWVVVAGATALLFVAAGLLFAF